ncbi:MAG: glycosyltransferase [Pseudolysinimonas sp.]
MFDRLIAIYRRLTPWEVVTVGLVLLAPFVSLVAISVGIVVDDARLGLLVVWAYFGLVVAVAVVALAVRLSLRRRFLASRRAARRWVRPVPETSREIHGEARLLETAARLPRRAVHNFGVRMKSSWAREIVAYRVSSGRLDFTSLAQAIRVVRSGDKSVGRLVLGDLDPTALVDLVRLMSSQDLDGRAQGHYDAILSYVGSLGPSLKVVHESQLILAERLLLGGHADLARPLVEKWATTGPREQMLATDLVNPFLLGKPEKPRTTDLWLGAFNQLFRGAGIEPVELMPSGPTVFDRLTSARLEHRSGGPLVTVIMTCFEPDESLVTAVRSVIAQSWTNWELLVMDDASPAAHEEVLDRVAAMDPRVRVVRARVNAGTYIRRNDALDIASGEFVTMHDSDDWAHPRRLELQVAALLESPGLVANLSLSVRVTEDLAFAQARGAKLRPAESSILFRRAEALSRIGYYDAVRKAADSEYRLRLEAAFGQQVPLLDTGGPLTLVRYLVQSLSGSEFRDGWVHATRVAYRSASWAWHERIRRGAADPYLAHPLSLRPFPVPARLEGTTQAVRDLDVVVILDGRPEATAPGYPAILAADLAKLAAAGTVGFQQLDGLSEDASIGIVAPEIQELVDAGTVVRILEGEEVHADVTIVRNVSLLQGLEPDPWPITTTRVIVIEDPVSGHDRASVDFTRAVTRTASAMFGSAPEYIKARNGFDIELLLDRPDVDDGVRDEKAYADLIKRFGPVEGMPQSTGWEARAGTLRALVDSALELPDDATILEAGSGLSTFWFARAAAQSGANWRIVALEHEHRFAEETRALLRANGLEDRAEVVLAPLAPMNFARGTYDWYAPEALDGVDRIGLLFVDGPPASVGAEARYPAFPATRSRLADGCLVVVDDADRHDERAILAAWHGEVGDGTLELERFEGRTAFLRYRS